MVANLEFTEGFPTNQNNLASFLKINTIKTTDESRQLVFDYLVSKSVIPFQKVPSFQLISF